MSSSARSRGAWPAPPQKKRLPSRGPIKSRLDRLEAELATILPPPPEAAFLAALTVEELVELEGIYELAEAGEPTTADRLRVIELVAGGWRRLELAKTSRQPGTPGIPRLVGGSVASCCGGGLPSRLSGEA